MATENVEVRLSLNAVGFSKGTNQAKASLKDLNGELSRLKSVATGALSFAGIGLGVSELVRAADQYGQITARLRLATKATGDFEQVQQSLRQAAEDTRAPLEDTVNLYAQIAPSLAAIGINSQDTVGIITTVNQAIALSGASAMAAQAALTQFTQGLASGTLRGEELNSILEQTPALADAIAKGLSVTRGELRALGADGALTAEAVATALQKVSAGIGKDFSALPLTVGQSLVLLNNSFTTFVGALDEGTGATSSLSDGIVSISKGIDALSGSIATAKPLIDTMIGAVDILTRFVRALGTVAGGTGAILSQLFQGEFAQAAGTYKQLFSDILNLASAPLASGNQNKKSAQKLSLDRVQVETELAEKLAKLENLRAVSAGNANADILKSAKQLAADRTKIAADGLKEQLKNEEALSKALAKSFQDSLDGAQKARDEAGTLRTAGRDARTNLQDKAAERRGRGLSEQDRSDLAERSASTLTSQATLEAGRASAAAREGDLKRAALLAESAAKLAERAEKSADNILDDETAARALEDLGKVQEKIANAQAQAKEQEAADLEAQAKTQNELLAQSEARIATIKAEIAKPITLQADIAQAESQIKILQDQLASLQDKTVTVTVNTVAQGAATAPAPAAGFAGGGWTGPGGKFQPAGVVHANEFVLRSEITRQPGVIEFMQRFNRDGLRALRGYASGGLVSNIRSPILPAQQSSTEPAVFEFPGFGRIPVNLERSVAASLEKQLRAEALKAGRR